MSSALSALIGDRRAQLIASPLLPALGIALLVLAIVINEMLSVAALADREQVEEVCGLCHVAWAETAAALGAILLLVLVASWVVCPVKQIPDSEGDDE